MKEQLNELIFNLMGGGGHLKRVPLEKAVPCLEYYWKRRSHGTPISIKERRLSVLILRHSWNCTYKQLADIFKISLATVKRDIDISEWEIQRNPWLREKYRDLYGYIVFYGKKYYH